MQFGNAGTKENVELHVFKKMNFDETHVSARN